MLGVKMSINDMWCVAVFKCKPEKIRKVLVEFYRFVKDLEGVKSLHFLIRDRVDGEVVFSFRVMIAPNSKAIIKSKMAYKLGTLLSEDKYSVDPNSDNSLSQYVAWDYERKISETGQKKFDKFCEALERMSKIVIQLIKSNYFTSNERVELSHVMSWMLGCAEYGLLSTTNMEIGYYDRIEHKYCSYLRQEFPKQE